MAAGDGKTFRSTDKVDPKFTPVTIFIRSRFVAATAERLPVVECRPGAQTPVLQDTRNSLGCTVPEEYRLPRPGRASRQCFRNDRPLRDRAVNAPFTDRKFAFQQIRQMTQQFSFTKRPPHLQADVVDARAINSLTVPVSPWINT